MGLLVRVAAVAGALVAGAVIAGCGSSVADADRRDPVSTTPPPTPFCAAAQANLESLRPLNGFLAQGSVPPNELDDTVDAVRRAGAQMVTAAPNEIRTDVELTVQALDLQLDALVASGGDPAAVTRDPQLTARLNSPEFTGARARVRAYMERMCTTTPAPR
jgi:hypothetical protein